MNDGIDHDFLSRLYSKRGDGTIQNAEQAEKAGYTVDRHCYPWIAYKGDRFNPDEYFYILTDNENQLVNYLNDASEKMEQAAELINKNTEMLALQKRLLQLCRMNSQSQQKMMREQRSEINLLKSEVARLQLKLKGRS